MKKRNKHYRKYIVAGALAGLVFGGYSGVQASDTQQANSTFEYKALRKAKIDSRKQNRRDEQKHTWIEKKEKRGDLAIWRSDIRTSLEKGDYSSFSTLTENHKQISKITQEQFNQISLAYQSLKAGNKEEAKSILKDLKLKKAIKGTIMSFGFDNLNS
jgi:hypothetical protein